MSALSGSGVEVDIYGQNLDSLTTASQQVMDLLNSVDGIENVSTGRKPATVRCISSLIRTKPCALA